jgi:hypothetical protein
MTKRKPVSAGALTERQCALLFTAARHGRVATETFSGRGAGGGRVSGGGRERQAASTLRRLGLLSVIATRHEMTAERGNTVHIYTTHWSLTCEGRTVIES